MHLEQSLRRSTSVLISRCIALLFQMRKIFSIIFPAKRISLNIFTYTVQVPIISNDMLVIIALPNWQTG